MLSKKLFINKKLIALALMLFGLSTSLHAQDYMFAVQVKGDGKPVILIPGLMSSGEVWKDVVDELDDKMQFHVLSVAGFAGQPPINNPSLERLTNDIKHYIESNRLSDPIVVGHSLGGLTAMLLGSRHPELVSKVVSVDGLPFIGSIFTGSNSTTVSTLNPQALQMKSFFESLSPSQLAHQVQMGVSRQVTHKDGQALVIGMAGKSHPQTVAKMLFDIMSTDLRGDMASFEKPLTLIGASGALPTKQAKSLTQSMYQEQIADAKNGQVIMNEQARHFVMLDAPQWLNTQLADELGI